MISCCHVRVFQTSLGKQKRRTGLCAFTKVVDKEIDVKNQFDPVANERKGPRNEQHGEQTTSEERERQTDRTRNE